MPICFPSGSFLSARRQDLFSASLIAFLVVVLSLASPCRAQESDSGPSSNSQLEELKKQLEILDAQKDLETKKFEIRLQQLEQENQILNKQINNVKARAPKGDATPLTDYGITLSSFDLPIQIQVIRACRPICDRIGRDVKAKIGSGVVIVVTDSKLLSQLRLHNQMLAYLQGLQKRLEEASIPHFTGAETVTPDESTVNLANAFQVTKSLLSNAADIFAFFRTKTDISGLVVTFPTDVLATKLGKGLAQESVPFKVASYDVGSPIESELLKVYQDCQAKAAVLESELAAVENIQTKPGDQKVQATTSNSNTSTGLTQTSGSPGDNSNEASSTRRLLEPPPSTVSPSHQAKNIQKKLVALAEFKAIQKYLTTASGDAPPLLVTLTSVENLAREVGQENVYFLVAGAHIPSGASRNLKSLFNSGTVSFTGGVAVWYALFDAKHNQALVSDTYYNYSGWQRMKDGDSRIPFNDFDDGDER